MYVFQWVLFVSFCCYCFLWDKASPGSPGWPCTWNNPPSLASQAWTTILGLNPVKFTVTDDNTVGGWSFLQRLSEDRSSRNCQRSFFSEHSSVHCSECSSFLFYGTQKLLYCASPSCSAPEETGIPTLGDFSSLLSIPSLLIITKLWCIAQVWIISCWTGSLLSLGFQY